MTWQNIETVTYNPDELASDIQRVRLSVGDTQSGSGSRPDGRNFSDAELQSFVDAAGTWARAVTLVLYALAAEFATAARAMLFSGDVEKVKTASQYSTVAAELRLQAAAWAKQVIELEKDALSEDLSSDAIAYGDTDATRSYFKLPPGDV